MTSYPMVVARPAHGAVSAEADTDIKVLAMWLHGRGRHTQVAYAFEAARLLEFVGKPLAAITLADLQGYLDSIEHLAPASRARALGAIKSLFSFGIKIGYLKYNPAAVLKSPKVPDKLAERILPEGTVCAMIALEKRPRDQLVLRLLYVAGVRAAEIVALKWRDVQANGEGGQITVVNGKGGKSRSIKLSPDTWEALAAHRNGDGPDSPVFKSNRGGPLSTSQVRRVVAKAAARVGVHASPHYMRHAHASHSLDRGCPASLVMQTLGHSSLAVTSRYCHARPNDSSGLYLAL